MNRFIVATVILCVGWVICEKSASAQQNLFNVPSSDVTEEKAFFFQQQFNFTAFGQSNTTLSYGLGRQFEIGINLLDLPFYDAINNSANRSSIQKNPDLLLNAQKGITLIEERWRLGIGTQIGTNPAPQVSQMRLLNYSYLNNVVDLPNDLAKLIVGGYFANRSYGGAGRLFGFQAGVEVPIIKDQFHFQADYFSGKRDISVGVVGGVVFLPRNWQLSFGAQFPSRGGANGYGGVVELTWVPGNRDKRNDKPESEGNDAAE